MINEVIAKKAHDKFKALESYKDAKDCEDFFYRAYMDSKAIADEILAEIKQDEERENAQQTI